jgi:hypothetical protein
MPAQLKTTLAAAGVGAMTAAAILAGATPAFAKSSETLAGPHVALVRQPFHLVVWVGDDGGAKSASSRLQVGGPRGGLQWLGTWHKLLSTGTQPPDWESYSFTVTENQPGSYTFRAVITGYLTTNPVTVVVVR